MHGRGQRGLGSLPDDGRASAKCTPGAGILGPITPNVVYHYGLVDADDIEDARQNCTAMRGTFEVL